MNKCLFLLLFASLFSVTHAQFTLTPQGFVPSDDPSKDFIVYDFEGKNQSELYRKVLLFINASHNSPQDILNEVPEDMITINGTQPAEIQRTKKAFYNLQYTITLRFKDDKIRIDKPTFECHNSTGSGAMITLTQKQQMYDPVLYRIFNPKNGKVEMENVKSQLESFFNNLCNQIANSIETDAETDW